MSLRSRSTGSPADIHREGGGGEAVVPVIAPPRPPSRAQKALSGTAHLANLLPTGTLLAFQILTPIFTSNGACDPMTRSLTQFLLLILASTAALACFTDSFRSTTDGELYYGLATPHGMWVFDDVLDDKAIPDLRKYKLRVVDFIHAAMTVLVFGAVALRDRNVVNCFYPQLRKSEEQFVNIVPIGIGLLCSMMFVLFPTRRHGVGYPVTN